MASKAQIKASNKYNRENTKTFMLKVNKHTETDILNKLESVDNKAAYLKQLIRDDLIHF